MLTSPSRAGKARAAPTDRPVRASKRLRATKKIGKNPWKPTKGFCARVRDPSSSSHMLQPVMFHARSRAARARTARIPQATRAELERGGASGVVAFIASGFLCSGRRSTSQRAGGRSRVGGDRCAGCRGRDLGRRGQPRRYGAQPARARAAGLVVLGVLVDFPEVVE